MTLGFVITGWLVQRDVVSASYASVEEEAKASFQAYESLWKARHSTELPEATQSSRL